jgi:hypothetical protein
VNDNHVSRIVVKSRAVRRYISAWDCPGGILGIKDRSYAPACYLVYALKMNMDSTFASSTNACFTHHLPCSYAMRAVNDILTSYLDTRDISEPS